MRVVINCALNHDVSECLEVDDAWCGFGCRGASAPEFSDVKKGRLVG